MEDRSKWVKWNACSLVGVAARSRWQKWLEPRRQPAWAELPRRRRRSATRPTTSQEFSSAPDKRARSPSRPSQSAPLHLGPKSRPHWEIATRNNNRQSEKRRRRYQSRGGAWFRLGGMEVSFCTLVAHPSCLYGFAGRHFQADKDGPERPSHTNKIDGRLNSI